LLPLCKAPRVSFAGLKITSEPGLSLIKGFAGAPGLVK
jgi:hypothetical protein